MWHKGNYFFRDAQDQVLFNTDEYVKRPTPNQAEFNALITPYIGQIEEAKNEAMEILNNLHSLYPPHYFLDKADPMSFNGFFIGKLKDKLGHENFYVTSEGRKYWQLGNYMVFIKKLDRNFDTANVTTINTKRIRNQYAKPTEEPKPIVHLGYQVSRDWGEIIGLYAVSCDKEQNIKWISDISLLERLSKYTETAPQPDNIEVNNEPRVKVREMSVEVI